MKYLDNEGLSYFWTKVKVAIASVQTNLTTHTSDASVHMTSAERTELGYLDGATSNIQTQIDTLSTTINTKPSMMTAVVYLSTSDWVATTDGYSMTVSVSNIATTSNLVVTPVMEYRDIWRKANVCCGAQGTNTLTFYSKKLPESTIAANVLILTADAVINDKASMSTATASLTTSGWSSTTGGVYKSVTVSGVTSTSNLVCAADKDSRLIWSDINLCAGAQGTNTITFYADKAPTSTVTVNILILN